MSKGLDRLEVIKDLLKGDDTSKEKNEYVNYILEPIEKELKEYEQLKANKKGEKKK